MENKYYVNHVMTQLESLLALGEQAEGAELVQGVLYNALSRIRSSSPLDASADTAIVHVGQATQAILEGLTMPPADGEIAPNPVDEILTGLNIDSVASFEDSLNEDGLPVIGKNEALVLKGVDEETGEEYNRAIVGGLAVDAETGDLIEIPGTTESIIATNEIIHAFSDMAGEDLAAITDGLLRVSYKREDEENLSDADVMSIINAPISEGLRRFSSNLQLVGIVEGESASVKTAIFSPVDVGADDLDITAIALGMVNYSGTVPFPSIGLVSAKAEVNLEWENN